jgi:uncharacterized membrane protein HdeD (DUF308 family)
MARADNVAMVDNSYFYWRGGIGILLGVLVLVWPKLTVLTLVTLLSIWLLLVGVMGIVQGVRSVGSGGFGWIASILLGILELGVGAYLVQHPGLTTLSIITLIGLVFFVQGFVYLFNTFSLRAVSGGRRVLSLLYAILSFVAGVWLWRYPFHGTLAFVWLIGLYAIASGALMIAMASEANEYRAELS